MRSVFPPIAAFLYAAAIPAIFVQSEAFADTFGSGDDSFEIEFVSIGNPGNASDIPLVLGDVAYRFRMGKYEISEQMIDKANALGDLGITKDSRGPDKPATSITWFEAAKFVNWLNIDAGNPVAYKFDTMGDFQLWQPGDPGYNPHNLYRNKLARYVLPSADEWYKAAYYDPTNGVYYDYPTGSDSVPDGIDVIGDPLFDAVFHDGASRSEPNDITDVGLLSPYGTAGQGGNVFEWDETAFDLINNSATEQRNVQGGSWLNSSNVVAAFHIGSGFTPTFESNFIGFRVVYIPEPDTYVLASVLFLTSISLSREKSGSE